MSLPPQKRGPRLQICFLTLEEPDHLVEQVRRLRRCLRHGASRGQSSLFLLMSSKDLIEGLERIVKEEEGEDTMKQLEEEVGAKAREAFPQAPAQGRGGSVLGAIGSAIADGVAFGTGNALGLRVAEAIVVGQFNTRLDSCNNQSRAFQEVWSALTTRGVTSASACSTWTC